MTIQDFENSIEKAREKTKAYLQSKYKIEIHDLEDIIQESSIKAFKKLSLFRGECSFDTWFTSIAKNEARTLFLKKEKESLYIINNDFLLPDSLERQIEDIEESGSLPNTKEDLSFLIQKSLVRLSLKQRLVIELLLKESSCEEISRILNIPISSVRTRIFYAKKKLKKIIKKYAHESNVELPNN